MAISRENFEKGTFKKRNTNRNEHPVTIFLRKNHRNAFTVKEICKATKMKEEAVRDCLRNLINEEKLVGHKAPYFIFKLKNSKKKRKKKKR